MRIFLTIHSFRNEAAKALVHLLSQPKSKRSIVSCKPIKTGVSFTWQGAWEYDPVSGTGSIRLRKDGRLTGKIRIKDGDESNFIAERAEEPEEPIPEPPSYGDKWRRRW